MEMGDILSNQKTGESFTSGTIGMVGRDDTDNLNALGFVFIEDGTTTDTVDRNTVNKISVSEFLPCADIAGEKTQSICLDIRKAEPSNFDPYSEGRAHWKECYGDLWKIKVAFEKKNDGRISHQVNVNNSLVRL